MPVHVSAGPNSPVPHGGAGGDDPIPWMFISFPSLKDPMHDPGPSNRHTGEAFVWADWSDVAEFAAGGAEKRAEEWRSLKQHVESKLMAFFAEKFPALERPIVHCELGTQLATASLTGHEKGGDISSLVSGVLAANQSMEDIGIIVEALGLGQDKLTACQNPEACTGNCVRRHFRRQDRMDPMKNRMIVTIVATLFGAAANAQNLTLQNLIGTWNYESYAEIESPDERMPVGARMDFRPDGTVVMTLSTGAAEGTFALDRDTIRYSDSNGEQIWNIRSYEPGSLLVLEYRRALMYFERVDTE